MANSGGPGYGFTYGPAPIDTTPRPINRNPAPINREPGVPVTSGTGQHAALKNNSARVRALPGMMTREQVGAMQQFLVNHGFNLAVDGTYGPLTKSAAKAFRANHKGAEAWNAAHGLGVHPAKRGGDPAPVPKAGSGAGNGTLPSDPSGAGSGSGSGASSMSGAFNALLTALLGSGGSVGAGYDPSDFGSAAAAPDRAQAATLASQIALNPQQEAQNQYDISSWYGLAPNDPNFQLSVLGRLATAGQRNAQAATDTAGNVSGIAKSLAGSIGGSANGASGSVLAAGADAAGLAKALGQADTEYANDMNPLLAAEARGQMSQEKAANAQALLGLRNQLAQAQGQATADRAGGVMSAQDKNNALAQQRFANEGNLLSTLTQLMAVDPNATALSDAKSVAQINHIIAQTRKLNNPATANQPSKVNLSTVYTALKQLSGGSLTPGSAIPTDQHAALAQNIATVLASMGIAKSNPLYKKIGDQIFGSFVDQHGRPLVAPPSWGI